MPGLWRLRPCLRHNCQQWTLAKCANNAQSKRRRQDGTCYNKQTTICFNANNVKLLWIVNTSSISTMDMMSCSKLEEHHCSLVLHHKHCNNNNAPKTNAQNAPVLDILNVLSKATTHFAFPIWHTLNLLFTVSCIQKGFGWPWSFSSDMCHSLWNVGRQEPFLATIHWHCK